MAQGTESAKSLNHRVGVRVMRIALFLYAALILGGSAAIAHTAYVSLSSGQSEVALTAIFGTLGLISWKFGWPALQMVLVDLVYQRLIITLVLSVDSRLRRRGHVIPAWFTNYLTYSGRDPMSLAPRNEIADEVRKIAKQVDKIEMHLGKMAKTHADEFGQGARLMMGAERLREQRESEDGVVE